MKTNNRLIEEAVLNERIINYSSKEDFGDFLQKKQEIEESNKIILSEYPEDLIKEKVSFKLSHKKNNFVFKKNIAFNSFLAAAAVFVIILSIPFDKIINNNTQNEIRIKGSKNARICLYKKDNNSITRLSENDVVKENDLLQLSYISNGEKYGVIFSIDGNGVLTKHLPAFGSKAEKLKSSEEVALDFSYKLDDAPLFERFVLITNDTPFNTNKLYAALLLLNNGEQAKSFDFTSFIPKSAVCSDFLLIKENF